MADHYVMKSFNVTKLLVSTGEPIPDGRDAEIQMNARATPVEVESSVCGVSVYFRASNEEGLFYSIEAEGVGTFSFPESMDETEKGQYVVTEGAMRVLDGLRHYVTTVTSSFPYGTMVIPDMETGFAPAE